MPKQGEDRMTQQQSFLAHEKKRQAEAKKNRDLFSSAAQPDGPYSSPSEKHPEPPLYPFCLPLDAASENLYLGVRDQVARFQAAGVPWHKGIKKAPTTHLCSSQVCCVNFLAPFATRVAALLTLVQSVFPEAVAMVPVAPDGDQYVEFEWIGDPTQPYLDEQGKSGKRTRGANCTSADAAVRYRAANDGEHVVLIEWKYCESYPDLDHISPERRLLAKKGGHPTPAADTRRARYEHRLPGVVALPATVTFDDLCVEPLYQLMRQQLLAREMEAAGEAESVSVLHLSPRANHDFPAITSPALREWAHSHLPKEKGTVLAAWAACVKRPGLFRSEAVEDFFASPLAADDENPQEWRTYICARYSWADPLSKNAG